MPHRYAPLAVTLALCLVACGGEEDDARVPFDIIQGTLGPEGGTLMGEVGTALEGVRVTVEPGALEGDSEISVEPVVDDTPLPENAYSIGGQYQVQGDAALEGAAALTVPFDPARMREFIEDIRGVKVWRRSPEGWATTEVLAHHEAEVTVRLESLSTYGPGVRIDE